MAFDPLGRGIGLEMPDAAFGIPIIGHALNIPQSLVAYLTAQMTPESNPWVEYARQNGTNAAWRDRTDIHPLLKFGAEAGVSMLPPFTGVAGLPGIISTPLTTTAKMATKGTTVPPQIADALNKMLPAEMQLADNFLPGLGPALKSTPGINWLFKPSRQAIQNAARENLVDLSQDMVQYDIDPHTFISTANQLRKKIMDLKPDARNAYAMTKEDIGDLPIGKGDWNSFREFATNMSDDWLGESNLETYEKLREAVGQNNPTDIIEQHTGPFDLLNMAYRKRTNFLGPKENRFFGPVANKLNQFNNQGLRPIMLAGGTSGFPNVLDVAIKTLMAKGLGVEDAVTGQGVLRDLFRDSIDVYKQEHLPESVRKIMGDNRLPAAAMQVPIESFGDVLHKPWITQVDEKNSAILPGVGAALGAAAGIPYGPGAAATMSGLGAAAGALLPAGFRFTASMMNSTEAAARGNWFTEGFKRYMDPEKFDRGGRLAGIFKPQFREESIDALRNKLGDDGFSTLQKILSDQQYELHPRDFRNIIESNPSTFGAAPDGLEEFMSKAMAEIAPDELFDPKNDAFVKSAIEQGLGTRSKELTDIYRDLWSEARRAGSDYSDYFGFNYSRPDNLTQTLKQFTPFPTWPLKNIPFYLNEAGQHPRMTTTLAQYAKSTEDNNEANGLPTRLDYKLPLIPVPGGDIWGNPFTPLSITTQFRNMENTGGNRGTGFDKIQGLAAEAGLGFIPSVSIPLQALGAVDRGKDFPNIIPWTARANALGQAITGQPVNLEAPIKGTLDTARNFFSPSSNAGVTSDEYAIRKAIAEESMATTGLPWFQVPQYREAVVNPDSEIYQRVARQVGAQKFALNAFRSLLPFQQQYASDAELAMRRQNDIARNAMQNSGASKEQLMKEMPNAFGISELNNKNLITKAMLEVYELLPQQQKEAYLRDNPELQALLNSRQRNQYRNNQQYASR